MRNLSFLFSIGLGGILALLLSFVGFVWQVDREWSDVLKERIEEESKRSSLRVMIRSPQSQNLQWLGTLSAGRLEDRQPVKMSDIPPLLIHSIVTLEDPRFLSHEGIDTLGILRALWANIKSMRYAQGGSTITQQLVKNVLLSNDKTIRRKLTEALLAALVEKNFSKDQILEAYLNEVYLGQVGPLEVHGIARGSDYYFNKKLSELDLHEMALIAAVVKGPGPYSPWRFPDKALLRRNFVLEKLFEHNLILKNEFEYAIRQALPKSDSGKITPIKAPYVMDALRKQLLDDRGEGTLLTEESEIVLSLDPELQEAAEKVLSKRSEKWPKEQQALLFAARPQDCSILAYVGGTHYSFTQLDHIRQMARPIGSLIKPLLVSELLDSGELNLAKVIEDQPLNWTFDQGRSAWEPQNYDRKFRGKVTLRQTLEQSLNVPLVRIFFEKNPSGLLWNELSPLRALGLHATEPRSLPSALLGSIEQSPWRVMNAYLKLTRRALGIASDSADLNCELAFQEKNSSAQNTLPAEELGYGQVGARLSIAALEGALRRGTSIALGNILPLDQQWAGKTGTSSDQRDSWYVLLSPDVVMLAWVGRDDNGVTRFTGASGALPLISDWVKQKKDATSWSWPIPENLVWGALDAETRCLKTSYFADKTQLSSTPPPEPFESGGQNLVWDLFEKNSLPNNCP